MSKALRHNAKRFVSGRHSIPSRLCFNGKFINFKEKTVTGNWRTEAYELFSYPFRKSLVFGVTIPNQPQLACHKAVPSQLAALEKHNKLNQALCVCIFDHAYIGKGAGKNWVIFIYLFNWINEYIFEFELCMRSSLVKHLLTKICICQNIGFPKMFVEIQTNQCHFFIECFIIARTSFAMVQG